MLRLVRQQRDVYTICPAGTIYAAAHCFYVKPLSGMQTPPRCRKLRSRDAVAKPRFLPDHPSGHASALGAIQWEKPSILQEEQHVNDNVNFYAGGARGAVTLREHIQLHAEYTPIDRI